MLYYLYIHYGKKKKYKTFFLDIISVIYLESVEIMNHIITITKDFRCAIQYGIRKNIILYIYGVVNISLTYRLINLAKKCGLKTSEKNILNLIIGMHRMIKTFE
jgi:hypothetical protein